MTRHWAETDGMKERNHRRSGEASEHGGRKGGLRTGKKTSNRAANYKSITLGEAIRMRKSNPKISLNAIADYVHRKREKLFGLTEDNKDISQSTIRNYLKGFKTKQNN